MSSLVRARPPRPFAALAATPAALLLAAPAQAQRITRVALSAGPATAGAGGVNAQASALFGDPARRFGLRVDATYFGIQRPTLGGQVSPWSNVGALTVNGVLNLRGPSATVRPYFIAGLGMYSTERDFNYGFSGGMNFGIGTTVPVGGREMFAELRVHAAADSYPGTVIPLSLGMRF